MNAPSLCDERAAALRAAARSCCRVVLPGCVAGLCCWVVFPGCVAGLNGQVGTLDWLVVPGLCLCRWAAARLRDCHTRACDSEWFISRLALALPLPAATAAVPCRPRGAAARSRRPRGAAAGLCRPRGAAARTGLSRGSPWPYRYPPPPRLGPAGRAVQRRGPATGYLERRWGVQASGCSCFGRGGRSG